MKYSWLLIIVISLVSCNDKQPHVKRQYLNHNWSLLKEADNSLVSDSVRIPSTVHKELLPLIEHPFQANNEDSLQWITEENWIYKTIFKVNKEILDKEHITLNFEGIDTYASIELNGHKILDTDNAFLNWQIDVKPFIEKENELYVTIKSPLEKELQKAAANPYQLPEGNRVYTRKAQFQYGWDWGPNLNTMGVWKSVYLEAYNDFKIKDIYLKQNSLNDSIANLSAQVTLSKPVSSPLTYSLKINDSIYPYKITDSLTVATKTATQELHFEIQNPKKWWPHNLGEPYLYEVEISIFKDENLIDQKTINKGLRTVELVNEPDEYGTSFYFKVNDVPVYAKGANYIPQNSMQDLVTDDHYEKLLNDAVDANMNMLRVWGGGIYESDVFYEKCDEKGIMVWQDFMFACAMYPSGDSFRESVKKEVTQQLTRLRDHSSIVLWCGNNESREGWHRWGWQEGRSQQERDSIWEDYRNIFQIDMPKYVAEMTKEPYWESSPQYGRGNPKYEFNGDAHDWRVWHDAYPFEHFEEHVPRFMSEFGFQAHPSYETIRYINSSGEVDIKSKEYATHQKHARGDELIQTYMERDFPIPENDEDYVYVSQLVQAYGMSKGIQAHRRARPYNMGTLYWQLNDCWPAVSWSSIDYFGNWKALHYQVKRDFENVLISNVVENDTLKTYVVNDNLETEVGDFKIEIKDFSGKSLFVDAIDSSICSVNAGSSELIHALSLKHLNLDLNKIYVSYQFGNHKSIKTLTRPKDLKLPKAEIKIKSPKRNDFYEITIVSNVFVKDLFVFSSIDGHFSDNFFDLEPNTEKSILFYPKSEEHGVLHINSLNDMVRISVK
ncbi:beta-mannosidase [Nonlabens tegetincola]|uniref:beta-mannosidase n=1 Tax=Nonlabens tegetincola TaxID=323273 RepID=UPI000CF4C599|nr:glycoside hydrolase family 2 protein [Nonlabens tegetincola]PQJ13918.1 beta-mannosidase [Nonlabens tegetincola]